jgi:hypothetical protein
MLKAYIRCPLAKQVTQGREHLAIVNFNSRLLADAGAGEVRANSISGNECEFNAHDLAEHAEQLERQRARILGLIEPLTRALLQKSGGSRNMNARGGAAW